MIKLPTLKTLCLDNCSNITFSDEICSSIIILKIFYCDFPPSNSLFVLPELEECKIECKTDKEKIINLFDSKKLRVLKISEDLFLELDNIPLESIEIPFSVNSSKEKEIKLIKKILLMNTLKNAELNFRLVSGEDILKIEGVNTSLTSLSIYSKDLVFYNLYKMFPNLLKINISGENYGKKESSLTLIEIKEISDSKINDIFLDSLKCTYIFNCGLFENLISVTLHFPYSKIGNITECFPIFSPKSKTIFKSLKFLEFLYSYPTNSDIVKNIMNNFDNMPKLEYFHCTISVKSISHKLYLNFIEKALSMNLRYVSIYISINKENVAKTHMLSENELRKMFPKIKFPKKLSIVNIKSLNSSDCLII